VPLFAISQINAVTENGYQIQVFDDGTWKYVDSTLNEKRFIKKNDSVFKVPKNSTLNVSSKVVDINIMFDEKDWYCNASPDEDVTEFLFNHKNVEIYGILIPEKNTIPLENLRNIALINARDNVNNLNILKEEYRLVNDLKVLYLCFEGEVEKMQLLYNYYFYSGEDGIAQLITYAHKNVAINHQDTIFKLLNGLTKSLK
jgi:hypothetical protein